MKLAQPYARSACPTCGETFETRTRRAHEGLEQTVAVKTISVPLAPVDSHQGPARLWPAGNKN